MRLNGGETDCYPDYISNIKKIDIKHPMFRCRHISVDYLLFQLHKKGAVDLVKGGTSADVLELGVLKAVDQTIINVTDMQAVSKSGGENSGEKSYAYTAFCSTTGEDPAFYIITEKTDNGVNGMMVASDPTTTVVKNE